MTSDINKMLEINYMNTSKNSDHCSLSYAASLFGALQSSLNTNQKDASNVIMLWPKDAASQDRTGIGTPRPDRGDGHIRLTGVTNHPYATSRLPLRRSLDPRSFYVGEDTPISRHNEDGADCKWLNQHGVSAFILIYRTPKKRKDAFEDIQRAVRIVRSRASGGT